MFHFWSLLNIRGISYGPLVDMVPSFGILINPVVRYCEPPTRQGLILQIPSEKAGAHTGLLRGTY